MLRPTVILLALALLSVVGCDGCEETPSPRDAAVVDKPPVPAPDGLVAKLVAPNPGRALADLREATGGGSLLVPRSVGGMAANLFGLPLQAVEHFDEELPIVGAAVSTDAAVHAAVAFHLSHPSRLLAYCTKGRDAKFTTEKVDEVVFLVPTGKSIRKPQIDATLAVLDNHLVAADSREGVRALGPYLTRTLGKETVSTGLLQLDLEKEALAEPLRWLADWAEQGAADVKLPPALQGVLDLEGLAASLTDTLGGFGGGRVLVSLDDTALTVSADLAPGDDAIDAPADVSPHELLALPDDVVVAAGWSESLAAREKAAKARVSALDASLKKSLGEAWTEADSAKVGEAVMRLSTGRGDTTTMALRCTGVGLTGLARGTVRDDEQLEGALTDLVGMLQHDGVQSGLEKAKLRLSAKRTRILEVPDDLWRLRLVPEPEKKGEIPEEIDLLALVRDGDYLAAAGMETVDSMQLLHAPDEERSLATKKAIASALGRLEEGVGKRLWWVLMLDAQAANACAVGKPGGALAAPIVLGVGPRGERVAIRLEIARPLLRVIVREVTSP